MASIYMLIQMGNLGHLNPRQWGCCELEKYHLPQGSTHRLDIQNQIISPEIVHTSHMDKAVCIYVFIYMYGHIHKHN